MLKLANDHLLNWPINNIPDYTVGIGAEHVGPADWFDESLALPKYRVQGRPDLARAIVREGARLGIMFAYLTRLELDDGISVPLHYLTPGIARGATSPPGAHAGLEDTPVEARGQSRIGPRKDQRRVHGESLTTDASTSRAP
jgi:hypothetical protein